MRARTKWTDERLDTQFRVLTKRLDSIDGKLDSLHRLIIGGAATIVIAVIAKELLGV
jgi:hypothetical protein